MSELPLTRAAAAPSKAETLEQLRRKMASIPARSDGGEPAMSAVMLRSIAEPTPIVASAQTALRTLPVPSPIAELLPRGGLARGTVASVSGAASLLVGLLASVTAGGSHAAVIGMPDLSLLAAVEQGADLSKIALVPEPKGSAVEVAAIPVRWPGERSPRCTPPAPLRCGLRCDEHRRLDRAMAGAPSHQDFRSAAGSPGGHRQGVAARPWGSGTR